MDRIKSMLGAQMGQATTEYSMILLIVCLVAIALGTFVKGGGLDGLFQNLVKAIQAHFNG